MEELYESEGEPSASGGNKTLRSKHRATAHKRDLTCYSQCFLFSKSFTERITKSDMRYNSYQPVISVCVIITISLNPICLEFHCQVCL